MTNKFARRIFHPELIWTERCFFDRLPFLASCPRRAPSKSMGFIPCDWLIDWLAVWLSDGAFCGMEEAWFIRLFGLLDNHSIWGVGQAVLSLAHHSSFVLFIRPSLAPSLHPSIGPEGLGDDPLPWCGAFDAAPRPPPFSLPHLIPPYPPTHPTAVACHCHSPRVWFNTSLSVNKFLSQPIKEALERSGLLLILHSSSLSLPSYSYYLSHSGAAAASPSRAPSPSSPSFSSSSHTAVLF